jgi:hypothetical protein
MIDNEAHPTTIRAQNRDRRCDDCLTPPPQLKGPEPSVKLKAMGYPFKLVLVESALAIGHTDDF